MGIRGLPHYISSCRGVFKEKIPLCNNRVIIDGNNFLRTFILSLRGEIDCYLGYGCNYDTYYSALMQYFCKLRACRLEPVVIFVGTTGCQEKIFERVKLRNQEKIDRLSEFLENNYSASPRNLPQPLLAKTTLVRCLNDLSIHHLTMDFEEDDEIAALANRWRCPIITADSDFYLYQYESGAYVIPCWRFDVGLTVHGNYPNFYLATFSYDSKDFAYYHGIERHFVALFAAVRIELDEGENFMSLLPLQTDERDEAMRSVLKKIRGLSESNSLEDILASADEYFLNEEDEERRERIENNVKMFSPKEPKIEYYSYLEEGETISRSEIRTLNGASLPDFFIRGFRSSEISRYFAGILAVRATSLYTQLEDLHAPSVNVHTTRIRAILWGILLKYDSDPTGTIDEFCRQTTDIVQSSCTPITEVKGRKVPALDDIPQMSEDDRLHFIYSCLDIDPSILESIPKSCWMFVLVTRYWYEKCQPGESYLQAVILCYIKLGVKNTSFSAISRKSDGWNISNRDLLKTRGRLQPHEGFRIPVIVNTEDRIQIHHKFSEWKTIYSEVYRLNEITLKPLEDVGPEQCFRGTFLFGLEWYLEKLPDVSKREMEIKNVLGASVYQNVYQLINNAVLK